MKGWVVVVGGGLCREFFRLCTMERNVSVLSEEEGEEGSWRRKGVVLGGVFLSAREARWQFMP